MKSDLSQTDINALLKAANKPRDTPPKPNRVVTPCRFETSGQFSPDQAGALNAVQETFAKGLSQSLGAYLRVDFETALASVEQMTFRESGDRITQGAYLLSVRFHGAESAIQIDQSLVFPLIDILLGGTGLGPTTGRDATEIEVYVMEGVAKFICHEIATSWGMDISECDLVGTQNLALMQRLLPANDGVVVCHFDIKVAEATGKLRILVPAITINALLRKLSIDAGQGTAPKRMPSGPKLGEKLLDCLFPTTLGITAIRLPVEKVLELRTNDVCDLGVPLDQPASFIIAGRDSFEAMPIRQGRHRAAQVIKRRPHSAEKRTGQQ